MSFKCLKSIQLREIGVRISRGDSWQKIPENSSNVERLEMTDCVISVNSISTCLKRIRHIKTLSMESCSLINQPMVIDAMIEVLVSDTANSLENLRITQQRTWNPPRRIVRTPDFVQLGMLRNLKLHIAYFVSCWTARGERRKVCLPCILPTSIEKVIVQGNYNLGLLKTLLEDIETLHSQKTPNWQRLEFCVGLDSILSNARGPQTEGLLSESNEQVKAIRDLQKSCAVVGLKLMFGSET